jgi:hypothetical protein
MSPVSDTNEERAAAQRVAARAAEPARRLAETVINQVLRDSFIDVGDQDLELHRRLEPKLSLNDPRGTVLEEVQRLRRGPTDQPERDRRRRRFDPQHRRKGRARSGFESSWNDHPHRQGPNCEVLDFDANEGMESPSLIVPSAVEAGAIALGTYIVGHRMGLLEARAAITDAWLQGKIEACSPEVTELLYCYWKSGPRLTPQETDRLWRRAVGFSASTAMAGGDVNRDFPGLFDELVQAYRTLLLVDDPDLDFESHVAEAVLVNTLVAVAENLTAHVPDAVRAQAADLWLDVWEAYQLLEDLAADVGAGCIAGPWPLVVQYTNRRGLEHLWMVHEAVEEVLCRVVDFDMDDREEAMDLDPELARAIGCLVAMTDLAAPSDPAQLPVPAVSQNGRQTLGPGRPEAAAARVG